MTSTKQKTNMKPRLAQNHTPNAFDQFSLRCENNDGKARKNAIALEKALKQGKSRNSNIVVAKT